MALVLAALIVVQAAGAGPHEPWEAKASLKSAPDGDTLNVLSGRGSVTVRLAGIDTPERGQAYWRSARSRLIALTTRKTLTISCYKTDRYGREVCRVKIGAMDVAAELLRNGLAWHYKVFEEEQPESERERYARLEAEARKNRIGLWHEADPMAPKDCRKRHRAGEKCR